jgi:hypothetical protein
MIDKLKVAKKTIYLTKNRTKNRREALDIALSIDDILYEKFKRLNKGLHREEEKLRRMGNVTKVIQKRKGRNYLLQITKCYSTPNGQIIEVL